MPVDFSRIRFSSNLQINIIADLSYYDVYLESPLFNFGCLAPETVYIEPIILARNFDSDAFGASFWYETK